MVNAHAVVNGCFGAHENNLSKEKETIHDSLPIREKSLQKREIHSSRRLPDQYHRAFSFDAVVEIVHAFGIPYIGGSALLVAAKTAIPAGFIARA